MGQCGHDADRTTHSDATAARSGFVSDFDSLREDSAAALEALAANGLAVQRFAESTEREVARLWDDNAELRDELHAVANRLEALTAFVTSNPAEIAAKIVDGPKLVQNGD